MPDQNDDQNAAPENGGNGDGNNQNQSQQQAGNRNDDGPSLGKFAGWVNKVTDKIPEGPIMGHVIPGWMAAHKVLSGLIIAAVAIPATAVLAGALHAWWNSSYTDDYKELLDQIARESAITCSLEDEGRKLSTYKEVQKDVKGSGNASIFGIVAAPLGWIPYIGGFAPDFEWMPNKKIYDALYTADQNDIRFYRADGGFEKDIQAVIFNDGANPPVMVYSTLDDGQMLEMMKSVRANNNNIAEGALVLSWNDAAEKYETTQVAAGATEVSVLDGLDMAALPVNSCLTDNSLTTRTIEGAKGLIPSMPSFGLGGDDGEEATTEEGGEAAIVTDDGADITADESVTTEPEAEEDEGFSLKSLKFWGGDDAAEDVESPQEDEDHSAVQPVRALNFG